MSDLEHKYTFVSADEHMHPASCVCSICSAPNVVPISQPLPGNIQMVWQGNGVRNSSCNEPQDRNDTCELMCQQLRLNESQRALLLDIGIDVNEIGEGRPIVLKFTR